MSEKICEKLITCTGNDFYNTLETILKSKIPQFLKNIMKLSGFDNALAFTRFEDSSFTLIEHFMRYEFDVELVQCSDTVENYLGIYRNCQEKFKLVCGHKLFINLIKETCQTAYKDHPTLLKTNPIFVDQEASILSDPVNSFHKKIGAQMISVYNDTKKITLSAWSWPARQVADMLSDAYKEKGFSKDNADNIDFQYLNPAHHKDLLHSIVKSDLPRFTCRIKNALAISLRVDGSTDRTQNHNVYVLGNIVSPDANAETIFLGFKVPESRMIPTEQITVDDIELMDDIFFMEDAVPTMPAEDYLQAIKNSVSDIMPWKDLFSQVSSMVTDGENINSGDHNGLWAKLKVERSDCVNFLMVLLCIWCVPHRINLAWKNTCQNNTIITNLIKEASSLSSYFHHSGQRTQKLRNISSKNTEEFQKFIHYPAYFQVRWTQFTHSLLTAVLRNWKASIEYFKNENEIGLLNRWLSYERIHLTSFVADVLDLYKRFQMTFERDSITIFDVFLKKDRLVTKLTKLKRVPVEGGWEELFLKNLVVSDGDTLFFGHILNRDIKRQATNETFSSVQRTQIIDSLIGFLNERLDQDRDVFEFLEPLLKIEESTSDESLKKCHSVIVPDLDHTSFHSEYRAAAVALTPYRDKCVSPLVTLQTLSRAYKDQFTVLKIALARIVAAKPHSADVERLINIYNKFKDKDRCSASAPTLFYDLYVYYNMGPLEQFDPAVAVQHWMDKKKRVPRPSSKSKKQEWFVGVFEEAESNRNRNIKIAF